MPKVIVYSTPTCPFCNMVKDFLKQNKIEFTEYDISADQEKGKEMMEKSGQTAVPVLDIDGKIIVGFDQEKIKEALDL